VPLWYSVPDVKMCEYIVQHCTYICGKNGKIKRQKINFVFLSLFLTAVNRHSMRLELTGKAVSKADRSGVKSAVGPSRYHWLSCGSVGVSVSSPHKRSYATLPHSRGRS